MTFVAGQCKGLSEQNWAGLAGSDRTLVIYMGVATASAIADKLISDGVAPDMPVAVIENATRPEQRVLQTVLTNLGNVVEAEAVISPALIVVGAVAALPQSQTMLDTIGAFL